MTCRFILALVLASALGAAGELGGRAQIVGGTITGVSASATGKVRTTDADAFVFVTSSATLRIPYSKINLIEYGQDVSRRVALAWAVSPIFLLSKSHKHFITLGYTDTDGKQQAIVLRVDKRLVRSALATLEARTGRSVSYQDENARKSRKS
jgi:hypothetical protein